MFRSCIGRSVAPVVILSALVGVASIAAAAVPESSKPVRIILNNWTSQIVLSKALGEIYTQRGYTVEFVTLETKHQWNHLHRGLAHIQVEVWEGTMADDYERVRKFGNIIDAGNHSATTREEWWYPTYVEEVCPGLPDWRALKRCAQLFADDPASKLGRYVAGPWEKPERARVRALDLGFRVDVVEKADDLWVELKKAVASKKPVVLFNWSPNWVEDRFDGKFVEFPDYDARCATDASWGVNKDRTFDCGNPKNGWLKKIAWKGLDDTWPCAAAILRDLDFTNAMISHLAALVDADGLTHDQAAAKWVAENKPLWSKLGQATCAG
ncbi:MAG: ABC transporter substrate-binding protein [Rhodospirillales bacterium]|nr:ABC transporter substrate-binding protein [Rhodospirillales bacterium]